VIVAGLNQIPGIRCARPAGAFYVFPNVEGTGMPSKALADYLLDKAGWLPWMASVLAVTAGVTCASVTPTRWKTYATPWPASSRRWPRGRRRGRFGGGRRPPPNPYFIQAIWPSIQSAILAPSQVVTFLGEPQWH